MTIRSMCLLAGAMLASFSAEAADFTLHDNGPISTGATHIGTGATAPGGGTWSEFPVASTSIFGFGAISPTTRLADDFTITQLEQINAVVVFAYDTGSASNPVFNAANLRIWDGIPGDAGASVVFGDTTTNRLASVTPQNIFRVTQTTTGTTRHVQAIRIDVNPPLQIGAGTYWVDFQYTAADGSGGFVPPVTIYGQAGKAGANALQSLDSGGTYAALVDTGPNAAQDVPFLVIGDDTVPVEVSEIEID